MKSDKARHYKKDCRSKNVDKGKGSNDAPSIETKTTTKDGGDVYLASTCIHVDHDVWLIMLDTTPTLRGGVNQCVDT